MPVRGFLMGEKMTSYSKYARIDGGEIVIRYSVKDQWASKGWPPRLAREYAQYIMDLAEACERADPRVIELVNLLESGPDSEDMEQAALRLHRAGYRKQRYS